MSWFDEAQEEIELESSMAKQINDATEWRPEEGDTLKGTLLQVDAVITRYGTAFKIYVSEHATGEVFQVFASHSMLKEELLAHAPSVGKGLVIRYDGKAEGEYGKQTYYVVVERIADPDDEAARKAAARAVFIDAVDRAETMKKMKDQKAKPDRDPAPAFNGSSDDELTAPF